MGIGVSIFLIAVGALLAFAVDYQLWWLDITVAGWVLMVVGVLGLLLTLLLWTRRRNAAAVTTRHYPDDPGPPPPP
jgi:NADH:ubiquinone oxidoreductase subunit H